MTNPKNEQDVIELAEKIKKLPKEKQEIELEKWRIWFKLECRKGNCLCALGYHIPFEREYFTIHGEQVERIKWYKDDDPPLISVKEYIDKISWYKNG